MIAVILPFSRAGPAKGKHCCLFVINMEILWNITTEIRLMT